MNLNALRAKLLPPCPALDFHVHPLSGFGPYSIESVKEDVRLLTEAAQRSGVAKMCLFSVWPASERQPSMQQCRDANDYVRAMRDQAPEWFLPFCYLTPMYPDESVREMERCVEEHRFVGVKLWVALKASDPGLDPILRRATELGIPVLQHSWIKTTGNLPGESFPVDVANLARRHPKARIIMAHLNGCGLRGIEAVADCPNLSVDTSGGDPESGMVEAAVARLGAGRVLFGSDAPIRHFGVQLGKTLGASLPARAKVDILWNNAARLLPPWAGVKIVESER
jgi:predicted TIM-barrel fold metal-dependent hydrolase